MVVGSGACVAQEETEGSVEQRAEIPPAPTGLVATVVSSTRVDLAWDPVPNAEYYVIYRGTAPGNEMTLTSSPAASATFQDGHLSPGQQYSYQVGVSVAGGESGGGSEVLVTTPGAITPPSTVTATAISTSRIQVDWSAVAGAAKYYVYQSTAGGPFSFATTVVAPGTSYTATGLAAGTMHSYQIVSVESNEATSAPSATASATTFGAAMMLPAPTGVTATAISTTRIQVDWTAVTGAVKYYIYQSQSGGPMTYVSTTVAPGTSYLATGLLPGTTYSYEIQAVDASDVAGPASAPPASATTPMSPAQLAAPTGVSATTVSSSRINVTWTAVPGAVKYYVFQAEGAAAFTYVGTTVAPGTSYLATGLNAGTTYSYVVQAVDAADVASPDSAPPASATTSINGLGSRWKFDDQTGSTAADSVGGRTGTLQGGTTFATANKPPFYDEDLFNPSYLSAPGGTGDFVSVPDAGIFDFTSDFSLTLWAKLPSAPSGTVHLIGKRAAGCGATQWELAQNAANGLHFVGASGPVGFGTSLAVNVWTQISVTYTGGTLRMYINGSETASAAYTVGPAQAGALQIGNAGSCGNAGPLFLDEVRVYDSALSPAEVSALGTPPPAPANLTGMVVTSTRVDLTWQAVPGADLYIIYRGTASGNQTFLTSLSPSTLSWQEGHLSANETSSWYVRSVVDGLVSAPSNEVVITTSGGPPAPTGVTATINANDPNRVELSWTAEPSAVKYYVYRSVNGGAYAFLTTAVAPTTAISDAGLAAGTYSYQVQVEDAGYTTSPMSAASSITIP